MNRICRVKMDHEALYRLDFNVHHLQKPYLIFSWNQEEKKGRTRKLKEEHERDIEKGKIRGGREERTSR